MAATIERFTTRFAPVRTSGSNVIKPVYGLAEGSLCVTAPPLGRAPLVDRLSREAFQRARAIEPAAPDDPQPLTFVACGRAIAGHEVRCVDASDTPVRRPPEGRDPVPRPIHDAGLLRATLRRPPPSSARTAGWTRATSGISRTAISSSPDARRTSSSRAAATSIRRRSKKRSPRSRACGAAASRRSASRMRGPARSVSWW